MSLSRRHFLKKFGMGMLGAALTGTTARSPSPAKLLKPSALEPGDTVGLVNPGSAIAERVDVEIVRERLRALDLQSKLGEHVYDRRGYLAGTDAERARDLNQLFADPDVDAILAVRGGWGTNRLLPFLDYDSIRRHPKIVMGYSDITSLLLALYAKSRFVTFHGPVGISSWNAFSVSQVRRLLFEGEAIRMTNPRTSREALVETQHRVQTITPGTARGPLAGGNLSVLTSLLGSDYLPDWEGHVLFLEDVGEDIYRIDRMMTQLKLAGVLDQLAGFVFGRCTRCEPGSGGYGSLTLMEVLHDHVAPFDIPAWYGSMIGHLKNKFTVPLGVPAKIDAEKGTIALQEPAVQK